MIKKFISEFIGTALLVLFGCGTAAASYKIISTLYANSATASQVSMLRIMYCGLIIALAFGLILTALVYAIGKVSGCHVNPAISLACLIDGRINVIEFVYYVVAQLLGGIVGALILSWIFGGTTNLGTNGFLTASALGETITMPIAFVIEVILTFVFALVVLAATKNDTKINGLIVGAALAIVHIFGLPFTGTSVNPARSLGPALLAKGTALEQVWVFILAPLVGAALAALFYKFVVANQEEEAEEPKATKTAKKVK